MIRQRTLAALAGVVIGGLIGIVLYLTGHFDREETTYVIEYTFETDAEARFAAALISIFLGVWAMARRA